MKYGNRHVEWRGIAGLFIASKVSILGAVPL